MKRIAMIFKAARQLGVGSLWLYGVYQLGLYSGHYRRVMKPPLGLPKAIVFRPLLVVPAPESMAAVLADEGRALLEEADRIVNDREYRQFGADFVPIHLAGQDVNELHHWVDYETGKASFPAGDIKLVWEPARFGWAFPLARAYLLTGDQRYVRTFWQLFDEYASQNPYQMGPNWLSGQEAAIRLVSVLLLAPVFLKGVDDVSVKEAAIVGFVREHAARIEPTLIYARAQNNNHLITEALGLLCAGLALPEEPQAKRWVKKGLRWLNYAFKHQITEEGEYIQYSNNYHRLMLQCATVAHSMLKNRGLALSPESLANIRKAVSWLALEVDEATGNVANYGHNDGAYLFPLAQGGFSDYRPVVQAGYEAFWGEIKYPVVCWDEMGLWLNVDSQEGYQPGQSDETAKRVLVGGNGSHAILRGHNYKSRPGHADQNHIDLWWQGEAIAMDAGTYLYNAVPPWDNQFMSAFVHNTVTVDGCDQMTRAGRFLWLDWSCGFVSQEDGKLVGKHDAYRGLGITHQRMVQFTEPNKWVINDEMLPTTEPHSQIHTCQIQWLLPDWDWEFSGNSVVITRQNRLVEIVIGSEKGELIQNFLCRVGKVVAGEGSCLPQHGWFSPTYSVKEPALSFCVVYRGNLPMTITSEWRLVEN
jgi:hypothetical protein